MLKNAKTANLTLPPNLSWGGIITYQSWGDKISYQSPASTTYHKKTPTGIRLTPYPNL